MGPLSDFVDVKHHVEFCEGIEWLHLSFSKWNPIHQQEWIKGFFPPMKMHNYATPCMFHKIRLPIMVKKKVALWDYIIEHYNQNHSIGLCERLARSLEPKWGIRKHDVSKFTINHSIVQTLPKSETLIKYATDKFFNSINPSTHNILFYFFPHCWLLSCKVPC